MGSQACTARTTLEVSEQALPSCVREVLDRSRLTRPDMDVTCIAFDTHTDGRLTARSGRTLASDDDGGGNTLPSPLRARDLLVLSVTVTETTFERVQTATHVLIAQMTARRR